MLTAVVHWPSQHTIDGLKDSLGNIQGYVLFEQPMDSNLVKVKVKISGLSPNTEHGFHIHTGTFKTKQQLKQGCSALGGHFNPFNKSHGSIYNSTKSPRHVGDLCNNIISTLEGTVDLEFFDNLISLKINEKSYIIGRSVVIHGTSDDLGRQGRIIIKNGLTKFKQYDEMTTQELKCWGYTPSDVQKLMKESTTNGNAGSRIACGIIH